jgi:hypothetical protein
MTSESSELRTRNSNGTSSATEGKAEDSPPRQLQHNSNYRIKLKSYLIALRVWSLSASIIPTILGSYKIN